MAVYTRSWTRQAHTDANQSSLWHVMDAVLVARHNGSELGVHVFEEQKVKGRTYPTVTFVDGTEPVSVAARLLVMMHAHMLIKPKAILLPAILTWLVSSAHRFVVCVCVCVGVYGIHRIRKCNVQASCVVRDA